MFPFFVLSQTAKPSPKKSGYKYIIEKYFSKPRSPNVYYDHSKYFNIFTGLSFYRESTVQTFNSFSEVMLGFNQKIKEIPNLGDLNLQVAIISAEMENKRDFLLEVTPRITIPETYRSFPLYIGVGAGVGFYPKAIIHKKPSLSLNGQFFIGLRFLDLYHNLGLSAELNMRVHFPVKELNIYLESLSQVGLIFKF